MMADLVVGVVGDVLRHVTVEHLKSDHVIRSKSGSDYFALHIINLYVWPAQDNGSSTMRAYTIHGYNVVSWRKGGFEFRAVSDLNTAELRDFAHLFMP